MNAAEPNIESTDTSDLPLVRELVPAPDVEAALLRFAAKPHCLLLDSALRDPELGRYSFLTADPFDFLQVPADGSDGLAEVARRMQPFTAPTLPDLPPFQGGAAGLLSYDLAHSFERLPRAQFDEFQLPAMAVGLYDIVLAWDHVQRRAWLISQGFPELEPSARRRRAQQRIDQFCDWLSQPAASPIVSNDRPLHAVDLAPQHVVPGPPGLTSNFSADGYRAAVQQVIDYILAGDVFQVNLSQRLLYPAHDSALQLYLRLRQRNPATFAAYFDGGSLQIASASPERFVAVRDGEVEARPIKGTRRRTASAEADLFAGDDLLASAKDRAENVMIVDLLRNDLSRVCQPNTVRVTKLCGLETYQFVQHLVSVVRGTLADEQTSLDLVRGSFPGGSITGAPKVRAMQIIAEIEPTVRGAYCGSLGYYGFNGTLDLNILIRTITAARGWWQLPVGGGIVAKSNPIHEYEETWHKAAGLLRALV